MGSVEYSVVDMYNVGSQIVSEHLVTIDGFKQKIKRLVLLVFNEFQDFQCREEWLLFVANKPPLASRSRKILARLAAYNYVNSIFF